jgi:Acetyltransferase (GNAT) domain
MLTVRRYERADQAAWDQLVSRSRTGHFLFKRDYMGYHADRFTDLSLLLFDGDRLVALMPGNRTGDEVVSHGGLTFGGLISDPRMSARRTLEAFEAVLGFLREQGVKRLTYKAVPHIYHTIPAEEDLYALFRLGARLIRRDLSSTIRMDTRLDYSKGRKASVKHGQSQGLEIGRSDDFTTFMAVETETLARHGATPTHSVDEMELLAGRFPDNIKLFCARYQGNLVAGVVIYETSQVAHTQYIGSTGQGKELAALDVLIDGLIRDYGDAGKRWFDFGISTEEQGRHLNAGLVRNKESYGARAIAYDQYLLDL